MQRKGGGIVSETKKEERVIVQCIDAFKDSERANRLIVPPMRLSVTPARAKKLIDAKVCVEVKPIETE